MEKPVLLLVLFTVLSLKSVNGVDQMEIDPIDLCIIACDACYKDAPLVSCANDCIRWDGAAPLIWRLKCPHFDVEPSVGQAK